jgi:hypothetical protein
MALYAASEAPLTGPEWREDEPGFHVQPLTELEGQVASRLARAHVVYLGAHTGCSCGFTYGLGKSTSWNKDAPQESDDAQGRASVAGLRRFLEDNLSSSARVQLLSCWEGDESLPFEQEKEVDLEFFGGDAFEFEQRVLYHVTRGGQAGRQEDLC